MEVGKYVYTSRHICIHALPLTSVYVVLDSSPYQPATGSGSTVVPYSFLFVNVLLLLEYNVCLGECFVHNQGVTAVMFKLKWIWRRQLRSEDRVNARIYIMEAYRKASSCFSIAGPQQPQPWIGIRQPVALWTLPTRSGLLLWKIQENLVLHNGIISDIDWKNSNRT